jgi:hypothetical protein
MIKYKQYMSGGIIGTETFNVGNPGNREVKGSLNNKGKVIKGKKSNKIIVTAGQLRQTGTSVRAKYGMTLDDYVDKAKEENPNIKLTMTPGQWLINPTENNEVINNDKKFNLMVQSSNVNVDLKGLHDVQSVYDNTISNFKKSIGNPDEENLDYWINSLFVPEAAKLKKQYPNDDLTFDKALKLTYDRYKYSQNNKGLHEDKDIATTHNNPGNIKYGEFAVKYGATPGRKATDGGVFAVFPSIEAGEEARRGLLRYGKNYRNLTVDEALKRWSNNGYNGSIVPNLAGLKIKDLTDDQFNQLSAAQIRSESNAMFNKLNKQHIPKNNSNEIKNQSGGEIKAQFGYQQLNTNAPEMGEIYTPKEKKKDIPQVHILYNSKYPLKHVKDKMNEVGEKEKKEAEKVYKQLNDYQYNVPALSPYRLNYEQELFNKADSLQNIIEDKKLAVKKKYKDENQFYTIGKDISKDLKNIYGEDNIKMYSPKYGSKESIEYYKDNNINKGDRVVILDHGGTNTTMLNGVEVNDWNNVLECTPEQVYLGTCYGGNILSDVPVKTPYTVINGKWGTWNRKEKPNVQSKNIKAAIFGNQPKTIDQVSTFYPPIPERFKKQLGGQIKYKQYVTK